MRLERSGIVDRPVSTVWDFVAVHHVENHPRWDPDVELQATSSEPLGSGSVIRRRTHRFGRTTEGTTEIAEFEHERRMESVTREGDAEFTGWIEVVAEGPERTRITLGGDMPVDESMAERILPLMQRSVDTIRALIEAET
jgi:hypothetical protein